MVNKVRDADGSVESPVLGHEMTRSIRSQFSGHALLGQDKIMLRVAVLTNFIPPYRLPLLEELQDRVGELRVFLDSHGEGPTLGGQLGQAQRNGPA